MPRSLKRRQTVMSTTFSIGPRRGQRHAPVVGDAEGVGGDVARRGSCPACPISIERVEPRGLDLRVGLRRRLSEPTRDALVGARSTPNPEFASSHDVVRAGRAGMGGGGQARVPSHLAGTFRLAPRRPPPCGGCPSTGATSRTATAASGCSRRPRSTPTRDRGPSRQGHHPRRGLCHPPGVLRPRPTVTARTTARSESIRLPRRCRLRLFDELGVSTELTGSTTGNRGPTRTHDASRWGDTYRSCVWQLPA